HAHQILRQIERVESELTRLESTRTLDLADDGQSDRQQAKNLENQITALDPNAGGPFRESITAAKSQLALRAARMVERANEAEHRISLSALNAAYQHLGEEMTLLEQSAMGDLL